MVRKTLFAASEAEDNENIRATKKVAAKGMIDSLALLAGSTPRKPEFKASKQSMSSILEQLGNLDLTQRTGGRKKNVRQFPNKTTTTSDDCLLLSLPPVANDTKTSRQHKKLLNGKNPGINSESQLLNIFAQENMESCRTKIKKQHRNARPTFHSSGGILGILEQPSMGKETREKVTDNLAQCWKGEDRGARENSVRPKQTSKSVLEQSTAIRRSASSPICSPSYSRYTKRSIQQRSPSHQTKTMKYFPNDETLDISLSDAIPHGRPKLLERQACPKSCLGPEVNTLFSGKALESAVPARPKDAAELSENKRFAENLPATVMFNVPEPLSQDPVVDLKFLKWMEKTRAAQELMNLELELRECLSVSTCSLTEVIHWDEVSENDSTMAVASPICDDEPNASSRAPSKSDLPTSPRPRPTTNIKRKICKDRAQMPISTKEDPGVVKGIQEERTVESTAGRSKRKTNLSDDPNVLVVSEAQVPDSESSKIKLKRIIAHRGPLNECSKDWMGCTWNLQVQWSDKSITWEPLQTLNAKYASQCTKYAEKNGFLDTNDKNDKPERARSTRNKRGRSKEEASDDNHKRQSHKSSDESKIPASIEHLPRRNRQPPVRYEPEQQRNKPQLESKTDALAEDETVKDETVEDETIKDETIKDETVKDWTSQELSDLKKAHASANPLSSTFWEDIAENVNGKTASDCCSRWMSSFPTPVAHKKTRTVKDSCSAPTRFEDDLFESTPWRGIERGVLLPKGLDLGSGIKLDSRSREVDKVVNEDEDDGVDAWKPRDGMRRYIQEMGRNVKRPAKATKLPRDVRPKGIREQIDMNGVNMGLRMSPGGTLNIKCLRDDNEDDFFNEYYGADEDEGEIYTQF